MSSAIAWFDIPAKDLSRAVKFYEMILGKKLMADPDNPRKSAYFPVDWQKGEVGGGLIQDDEREPSDKGTVIYLDCGADLLDVKNKVEKAGGKVLMAKRAVPMEGAGFVAMIRDSEGNKVGLWSPK